MHIALHSPNTRVEFLIFIWCFFFSTVLDDEDEESVITAGSIVTVSVIVKRRNLAVSLLHTVY